MSDFTVCSPANLTELLQAFRKQAALKQSEIAVRLGVTQQTISALERNADKVSVDRLLQLLSILGVEMVLHKEDGRKKTEPHRPRIAPPSQKGKISTDTNW
ncbi:hypothetical protein AWV79_24280 [Cupriavidus sp. UYMMa02A]|nr:hypothetical protein AWV79_24280 [Cupriavidus sp. UYMMa02A]